MYNTDKFSTLLQSSLALLNVSGNCLDGLQELSPLKKLATIIATDNRLSSMKVRLLHSPTLHVQDSCCPVSTIYLVEVTKQPTCMK